MKAILTTTLIAASFALTSCNTARTLGSATGEAVKATGNAAATVAEGTMNTGRKVGDAVREDSYQARRAFQRY